MNSSFQLVEIERVFIIIIIIIIIQSLVEAFKIRGWQFLLVEIEFLYWFSV